MLHTLWLDIVKKHNLESDTYTNTHIIILFNTKMAFSTDQTAKRSILKLVYIRFLRNMWRILFDKAKKRYLKQNEQRNNKKYRSTGWNVGASKCIDTQ